MNEDELFRFKMHKEGPPGFQPCTRPWPHDGPCAHEPEFGFLEFAKDYDEWLRKWTDVRAKYEEAMPCLAGASCCYHVDMCRNCRLGIDAADAIAGGPPDPRDYRPE